MKIIKAITTSALSHRKCVSDSVCACVWVSVRASWRRRMEDWRFHIELPLASQSSSCGAGSSRITLLFRPFSALLILTAATPLPLAQCTVAPEAPKNESQVTNSVVQLLSKYMVGVHDLTLAIYKYFSLLR